MKHPDWQAQPGVEALPDVAPRTPQPRYNALSAHFRRRFGRPARKIILDAGFSCPNRDGTVGISGCAFCNPAGSGSGLAAAGLNLERQWADRAGRLAARPDAPALLAYLQAYSNTHGPVERVADMLRRVAALPGVAGACVGTRPDCLDDARLNLLAGLAAALPAGDVWLDLGLQSASDATLSRIGRGHDFAAFAWACEAASSRGLQVCAHVMAGLPGEGPDDFLDTVRRVNALPIAGIKLHNLLVARNTAMARDWAAGRYTPLERREYIGLVVESLRSTRPEVVIHRLQADPAPGELLAPEWAADKRGLLEDIRRELERRDAWQGEAT